MTPSLTHATDGLRMQFMLVKKPTKLLSAPINKSLTLSYTEGHTDGELDVKCFFSYKIYLSVNSVSKLGNKIPILWILISLKHGISKYTYGS